MIVLLRREHSIILYFENYEDYLGSFLNAFDFNTSAWAKDKTIPCILYLAESSFKNYIFTVENSKHKANKYTIPEDLTEIALEDYPNCLLERCSSGEYVYNFIRNTPLIDKYYVSGFNTSKFYSIDEIKKDMSRFIYSNSAFENNNLVFPLLYFGMICEYMETEYNESNIYNMYDITKTFLTNAYMLRTGASKCIVIGLTDVVNKYGDELFSYIAFLDRAPYDLSYIHNFVVDVANALLDIAFFGPLDMTSNNVTRFTDTRIPLLHIFDQSEKYVVFGGLDKLPYLSDFYLINIGAIFLCSKQTFIDKVFLAGLVYKVFDGGHVTRYNKDAIEAIFDIKDWFDYQFDWDNSDLKLAKTTNSFINNLNRYLKYSFAMLFLNYSWSDESKGRGNRELTYRDIEVENIDVMYYSSINHIKGEYHFK